MASHMTGCLPQVCAAAMHASACNDSGAVKLSLLLLLLAGGRCSASSVASASQKVIYPSEHVFEYGAHAIAALSSLWLVHLTRRSLVAGKDAPPSPRSLANTAAPASREASGSGWQQRTPISRPRSTHRRRCLRLLPTRRRLSRPAAARPAASAGSRAVAEVAEAAREAAAAAARARGLARSPQSNLRTLCQTQNSPASW